MTTSGCASHCWLPTLHTSHPDTSCGAHAGGSGCDFALPLAAGGASGAAGTGVSVSPPMKDDCMRTTACALLLARGG